MSEERRFQLIDELGDTPKAVTNLGAKIDPTFYIGRGNWDLLASAYQQAFDVMWDYAFAHQGNLTLPLLMLCRQSIELHLKSAIKETTKSETVDGHKLVFLFDILLQTRKAAGHFQNDDDAETHHVRETLEAFESLDRYADRFRYPIDRRNRVFEGISVDLEKLYQAHWIITGWSYACSCEADGYPPADLTLK